MQESQKDSCASGEAKAARSRRSGGRGRAGGERLVGVETEEDTHLYSARGNLISGEREKLDITGPYLA